MSSLGRNGLIGLGIGVTVSTGLIAVLIVKELLRRRSQSSLAVSRSCAGFTVSSAAGDGRITLRQEGGGEEKGRTDPIRTTDNTIPCQ